MLDSVTFSNEIDVWGRGVMLLLIRLRLYEDIRRGAGRSESFFLFFLNLLGSCLFYADVTTFSSLHEVCSDFQSVLCGALQSPAKSQSSPSSMLTLSITLGSPGLGACTLT